MTQSIEGARLFRTDSYTHQDKRGVIDRQIDCHVYVFPDWRYTLVFEQVV